MELNLDQKQMKFKVIIGDVRMKYPVFPIINYCPNWKNEIFNDKKLIIDSRFDLNGVRDFFEGLSNNTFKITIQNCNTVSDLAKLAGSEEIYAETLKYINESQKSIPEIMNEMISEKPCDNCIDEVVKKNNMIYLSQHYNEILKFPELLKNIEITRHYNILRMALKHYDKKNFDIHGLFSFVINLLKNEDNKDYSILLSLFDPMEFNTDEIEQLINCVNFEKSCLNFKTIDFLNTIRQNKELAQNQEEKIRYLEAQIEQMKESLSNNHKQLMKTLEKQIRQIKNDQESMKNDVVSKINQINDTQKSMNEQATKKYEKIASSIEKNQTSAIETTIILYEQSKQVLDDQNSKLQAMCMQQQSMNEQCNQIYKEIKTLIKNDHKSNQDQNKKQYDEIKALLENYHKSNQNQMKKQYDDMKALIEGFNKSNQNQNKKQYDDMKVLIENDQKSNQNQMKKQYDDMKVLIENDQKSNQNQMAKQHDEIKASIEISKKSIAELKTQQNQHQEQTQKLLKDQNSKIQVIINKNDQNMKNQESNQAQIKQYHEEIKNQTDKAQKLNDEMITQCNIIEKDIKNIKQFIPCNLNCTCDFGIFNSFYHTFFKYPFINEIVEINGNSGTGYSKTDLEQTTKNSYSGWKSSSNPNSEIRIDFKKRQFSFKGIQIANCVYGNNYLRGFSISGKDDFGSDWELISEFNAKDILTESNKSGIFYTNHSSKYYRYVSLKMTTPNAAGKYIIEIKNLDLFGKLK